jgi:hypothetical protein
MISHEHKVIFIHIPKCAGSSIEKFFGVKQKLGQTDYEKLYGWDPERKIYLQHATAEQLLSLDLIDEETWRSYFKFAFVRNPWSRAYSDYFWMMRETKIKDSFKNFLLRQGKFEEVLNAPYREEYRGEHLAPQLDFLTLNDEIAVDFVGKVENLSQDFRRVREICGVTERPVEHINQGTYRWCHYSHFYTRQERKLVERIYREDIEQFGYWFEKRGSRAERLWGKFLRSRSEVVRRAPGLGLVWKSLKTKAGLTGPKKG